MHSISLYNHKMSILNLSLNLSVIAKEYHNYMLGSFFITQGGTGIHMSRPWHNTEDYDSKNDFPRNPEDTATVTSD